MKKGFTLIELIFTIVILAITTMAIPRIVAQTAKSNEFAIKQELVLSAKTFLTSAAKAPWDTSYVAGETSCGGVVAACTVPVKIHSILNGAGGVGITNCPDGQPCTLIRPGILNTAANSRAISPAAPTPLASFGNDKTTVYNDIDDYNGYNKDMQPPVKSLGGDTDGDFLLTTNIRVAVDYVTDVLTEGNYVGSRNITGVLSDQPANGTPTNLKMITITASDAADPNSFVVLRTYSANIGNVSQSVLTR